MITHDPNDPTDVTDWNYSVLDESDAWDSYILAGNLDDFLFPDEDPETWDRCDTCAVQIRRTMLEGSGGWLHEPGAWEQTLRKQPLLVMHQATPHSAYVTLDEIQGPSETLYPQMPGH